MISHVNNINRNVAALLNKYGEKEVMAVSKMKHDDIVQLCRTHATTRLKRLERLALSLDTTVAELMLNVDVETNWYKDARAEYIAINLRNARKEEDAKAADIAVEIDCENAASAASKIWSYESGQALPPLGMLQRLADLYEVEVADLMLPIELKEEP